eukprot:4320341-Lingulodinium_polyedra.AAC.1
MRSNKPFAAAAVRSLRVRASHARSNLLARSIFWRARGARERAIIEPLLRRTVDSTATCRAALKQRASSARASPSSAEAAPKQCPSSTRAAPKQPPQQHQ